MYSKAVIAALAALPAVIAQDITSSATRCTTRFGYFPLPTGTASVPTWFRYTTTTNLFRITYTTRDTVTVTPDATTLTDVITTTTTFSTTTTSTATTTVPTPAGFMNLLQGPLATPTAFSRVKRQSLVARDAELALRVFKRQTAANSTGGFTVDRNGQSTDIYKIYPQEVRCRVAVTVNSTTTTIVTGLPETETAVGPAAATFLSTRTVSTTTTVTAVAPVQTEYAGCGPNNVVSSVTGFDGRGLTFYRLEYADESGFPINRKVVLNATSPENCCKACFSTAGCLGNFYVPGQQECHLHLDRVASLALPATGPFENSTEVGSAYPTNSLVRRAPSGTVSALVPLSTALPELATCSANNTNTYLGRIIGTFNFPSEVAMSYGNGPCGGYFSLYPMDVPDGENPTPGDDGFKMLRRLLQ